MRRTTIHIPESLLQRARIKALREQVTVSEVIRDLLSRWVGGQVQLGSEAQTPERLVALARSAQGMWADWDADAFLIVSRGTTGSCTRGEESES